MIVSLGNLAACFAAAGWLLFTLLYATMAPWWRSPIGRNMLSLGAVLAAVFLLVAAQLAFGIEWPAREWVRAGIFTAVAVAGWHRLYVLLVDQIFAARQPSVGVQRRDASRPAVCGECGK